MDYSSYVVSQELFFKTWQCHYDASTHFQQALYPGHLATNLEYISGNTGREAVMGH